MIPLSPTCCRESPNSPPIEGPAFGALQAASRYGNSCHGLLAGLGSQKRASQDFLAGPKGRPTQVYGAPDPNIGPNVYTMGQAVLDPAGSPTSEERIPSCAQIHKRSRPFK